MLLSIVSYLFQAYELAILVYVLMSWFPGAYATGLGRFIVKIVDPYLSKFRFIPPIFGLSFSPIIALIFLDFVKKGTFLVLIKLGLV
ncbi:YggT family protein [Ligilactobacillus hayakitensis]|nr:YggT family protein [Ligilactobacillus hayakitensis]